MEAQYSLLRSFEARIIKMIQVVVRAEFTRAHQGVDLTTIANIFVVDMEDVNETGV